MIASQRIPWFRRLYFRIFLSVLTIVALMPVMLSLAWYSHSKPQEWFDPTLRALAMTAAEALPPATASDTQQRDVIARWQSAMQIDVALYDADGRVRAAAGQEPWISNVPPLSLLRLGANPPDYPLPLGDGRWLLLHDRVREHMQPHHLVIFIGLLALVIAVGCYFIARRLTRRLERLQRGVMTWGQGSLSERVKVEGHDEVANLAHNFNRSAERIDSLMRSQRALLANTSHELRSPLTRLRMAAELLPASVPDELRREFEQNIAELRGLVGEILLAGRLEAKGGEAVDGYDLDFKAIAAEECAAAGASLHAEPSRLRGDPVLLRRLIRNLLENARRHGGDRDVEVRIVCHPHEIELIVSDQGPGIPANEREHVFEPFYRLPGASEADGGVGLGLSLVRQIARAHGGSAECIEPKSAGALFVVSLPR
jgi:signal transduction histidine kinase